LVNQLVDLLLARTHGTSFIISFRDAGLEAKRLDSHWRSTIATQAKTLIPDFSRLQAPLAPYKQLVDYASKNSKPEFLNFMAELANLDGGLRLHLSKNEGLQVWAAQQFIPLLTVSEKKTKDIRLLDLKMDEKLLGNGSTDESHLPKNASDIIEELPGVKTLFKALNGGMKFTESSIKKYVDALSFLDHSGTKTHSLWGMSMTAAEACLGVVISSDGHVYVFHDGREFTRLEHT